MKPKNKRFSSKSEDKSYHLAPSTSLLLPSSTSDKQRFNPREKHVKNRREVHAR
jgi:hypothetical protein